MEDMPRKRPPHVQREINRHGTTVWYFRIGNGKRTRLPGAFGSAEFKAAYNALLSGADVQPKALNKNTLGWLIERYKDSAAFLSLKPSTQKVRANILRQVAADGGKVLIAHVTREMIAAGRDRRATTPFAAINFMKTMGYLFEWAVDSGFAKENPVRGVKRPKARTDGHAPWTEEDIIAFYRRHPPGSQARLAIELLMFTGLRRSDVYRIGPQHVKDDIIEIRATKNNEQLFIALHPILKTTLSNVRSGHLAYLVTPVRGKPFKTAAAFGNWFGGVCREAGVSGRAHGIRKSLAQKLAESGGSNAELKALFGWSSDAMVALYTKGADRRKMAAAASEKLKVNSLSPHLSDSAGIVSFPEGKTKA